MFSTLSSPVSRRQCLKKTLALTSGLSLIGMANQAHANGGYKALVCVFLNGGNDGLNTLVPTDASYAQYAHVRGPLALPKAGLLNLNGVPFGLHASLPYLRSAWNAGRAAAILNVGPLMRPFLDKDDYLSEARARTRAIPLNLFSHSDQQRLWQAADGAEISKSGWGGRAGSMVGGRSGAMSMKSNAHFIKPLNAPPLVMPRPGASFSIAEVQNPYWEHQLKRYTAYTQMHAQRVYPSELMDHYAAQQREAMALSDVLAPTVKAVPANMPDGDPIKSSFTSVTNGDGKTFKSSLASQLFQAAKLIRLGSQQGRGPQIFFVEADGYDTHADQINQHAALLAELDNAISAFDRAIQGLGLGNAVTVFTQSDFGRTLLPNSSGGTDHAWGNHQFVIGGAVLGQKTYGAPPMLELGGPDDVGSLSWDKQGRWIPRISVDVYAATLLKWLGLSPSQLNGVLPNLQVFPQKDLGFMRI